MPGPASTESRWAPTTMVRSLLPRGESAITLNSSLGVVVASTTIRTVAPGAPASSAPMVAADHRCGDVVVGRSGGGERSLAVLEAVVEDQRRRRARIKGVLVLLRERAGTALDQRDRSRRHVVEVRRVTPADGRARAAGRRNHGVAGHEDRTRDVARAGELRDDVVGVLDVGGLVARVGALESRRTVQRPGREVERVESDPVSGPAQSVGHVLDRGVVARRRCSAIAIVGDGDVLERPLVLEDAVDGHSVAEIPGVDPVDGGGDWCGDQYRRQRGHGRDKGSLHPFPPLG